MNPFEQIARKETDGIPVYEPGRPIEDVARERGLTHIIKMASNENPWGPSPQALEAMRAACEEVLYYPDGGCFELKKALASFYRIAEQNIVLGNGSNDIIEMIAKVFLSPGDQVLVSQYTFLVYPIVTKLMGAELITVPMRQFKHDLDQMAKAISSKTKVVVVCNPNNPTGTYNHWEEMEHFLKQIPAHVIVVIDEAYVEYAQKQGDYKSAALALERFENVIVLRTFSKAYALAGLRVGYAFAQEDIARLLNKVRQPFNVNLVGQKAALAALKDQGHVQSCVNQTLQELTYWYNQLEQRKLVYLPSAANFLLIQVGEAAGATYEKMLDLGVIVRPMNGYGLGQWLRITIGTHEQNKECLRALDRALGIEGMYNV